MAEQDQSTSHSNDSHDLNKADSAFNRERVRYDENREGITSDQDVSLEEAGQQPLEKSRTAGYNTSQRDPKLVTWDGPDDPDNPKNWSKKKKWTTMTIVSLFTLISPLSSTMVAPALQSIAGDFDIKEEFVSQLTLSVFILAYAVGPLFLGPLSEVYGRAIVLQLANLFYLAFNTACGVSQSGGQSLVMWMWARNFVALTSGEAVTMGSTQPIDLTSREPDQRSSTPPEGVYSWEMLFDVARPK